MIGKSIRIIYKIAFSLLGFSAIIREIVTLAGQNSPLVPVDFFSYFTIQSNLFAAIILLVSAWSVFKGTSPKALPALRGASVLYMVITGIVFAVLLSGYDPRLLTAVPVDNTILHHILPVVLILDWILDPPKERIPFRQGLYWIIYPILYVIYSLIRGPIVHWYAYPFLDPDKNGGYLGVFITTVIIAALSVGLIWLLTRIPLRIHHTAKVQHQ